MKNKLARFILSFILYCLVFLIWNGWSVTGKQIAEMIFIGSLTGLFLPLMENLTTRLIQKVLQK